MIKRTLTANERREIRDEVMKAEILDHPTSNISVFIRHETNEYGMPIAEVKRKFVTEMPKDWRPENAPRP
jgi:hypothetical protein